MENNMGHECIQITWWMLCRRHWWFSNPFSQQQQWKRISSMMIASHLNCLFLFSSLPKGFLYHLGSSFSYKQLQPGSMGESTPQGQLPIGKGWLLVVKWPRTFIPHRTNCQCFPHGFFAEQRWGMAAYHTNALSDAPSFTFLLLFSYFLPSFLGSPPIQTKFLS